MFGHICVGVIGLQLSLSPCGYKICEAFLVYVVPPLGVATAHLSVCLHGGVHLLHLGRLACDRHEICRLS